MKLSRLIAEQGATLVGEDVEIKRVVEDSREVQAGDLFVAVVRDGKDGHAFIDAAISAGASAVCVQRQLELSLPQIVVASTAQALGELASALHEHPRTALKTVAITGTNGKTTPSYLI